MSNANRTNLAVLRARARGTKYMPAIAMSNTLTDPAKLLLAIPDGKTWYAGARGQLRPVLFDGTQPTEVTLLEFAPAQATKGLLTEKGNANATPAWIDGFAAVPTNLLSGTDDVLNAKVPDKVNSILSVGRVVWKGDEQVLRTMYFGDMQRREMASAVGHSDAGTTPTASNMGGMFQAACGAPGAPVYPTPGFCWTGRASADWYVETLFDQVNDSGVTLYVYIYVYGQYILNIDPLQAGTVDLIRGGTFGAAAGACEDNGVQALDMARSAAMANPSRGSGRTTKISCGK